MGIYLALYGLSDATIERLHADPPLAWRVMDLERPEVEAKARTDEPENVGYLLEDVRRLRETVSAVASRGLGLLVSIS